MEEIIKVKDHIEKMEQTYEKDEFSLGEIVEYVCGLGLEENEKVIEVITCTRKEFTKGILATVRY